MNNFFRRTLTGVWIVIFVMGGFWLHPLSFFLTGLVILLGTLYEYYLMIRSSGLRPQMVAGMIAGIILYILATLSAAGWIDVKYLLLLLIPVAALIMIIEIYRKQEKPFDSLAHTFFPIIYTAVPLSLFPFTAFGHEGLKPLLPAGGFTYSPGIVVGFFILLWVNDSGAYLTGVTMGRHKLMERISPKKSWEGFFGGALLSLAAAFLVSRWLGVIPAWGWMVVSAIISVAGTYGDLVESMLKRSLGVKDSGSIMPGHGGFLDRFDSTLLSFPLVYLFISLFV